MAKENKVKRTKGWKTDRNIFALYAAIAFTTSVWAASNLDDTNQNFEALQPTPETMTSLKANFYDSCVSTEVDKLYLDQKQKHTGQERYIDLHIDTQSPAVGECQTAKATEAFNKIKSAINDKALTIKVFSGAAALMGFGLLLLSGSSHRRYKQALNNEQNNTLKP